MSLQSVAQLIPTIQALKVQLTLPNPSTLHTIFNQCRYGQKRSWHADHARVRLLGHSSRSNIRKTEDCGTAPGTSYQQEVWRLQIAKVRHDLPREGIECYDGAVQNQDYSYKEDICWRFKRTTEVLWSRSVTAYVQNEWILSGR